MSKVKGLSSKVLKALFSVEDSQPALLESRPRDSLIELFNWAKDKFATSKHEVFVNNKMAVNDRFLEFCKAKKVEIKCLHRDSIATWSVDDSEEFIFQGVISLTYKEMSFIGCALFHKGTEYEDEVSFFNLVKDTDFDKYTGFRNMYEKWLRDSNREAEEIYVVGGDPIPYEKNIKWEDLYLTDEVKSTIRNSVSGFLKSEALYKKHNIPYKLGMLFHGEPGNGKTTAINVLMSDFDLKPVTVQAGIQEVDRALEEAFDYAEYHGPSLLFLEDLPDFLESMSHSHFLQLLDGVKPRNGLIIIATANDLSRIQTNVTDRPSRFDRKILFDLPNQDLTIRYLKHWYKDVLTDAELQQISRLTIKNKFCFTHLKALYLTSMHEVALTGKTSPTFDDVKKHVKNLMDDRKAVSSEFETKKLIDSTY